MDDEPCDLFCDETLEDDICAEPVGPAHHQCSAATQQEFKKQQHLLRVGDERAWDYIDFVDFADRLQTVPV